MKNVRNISAVERLMPLAFVASVITGIGLHIAGCGASHGVWHNWAVAHVMASLLWLVSGIFHVNRHRRWYTSLLSKGIGRKSRITVVLSAAFLSVVVTGVMLLACVDGANSGVGLWHYWLGILLSAISFIHIAQRRQRIKS